MTLSFDSTQARGMRDQLSRSLSVLKSGRDLDLGTIRHTAGRLGWYAEVLQSGRCRTKSWWDYTRFWKQLRPANRARLIKDTEWWLEKLVVWADKDLLGIEYPILTADETLKAPHSIYVVQSDASGDDGFGFAEGFLEDENPSFVSRQWGDGYTFVTSHNGELQAFLFWIRSTVIQSKLVVWVSDCLSAVWSVNKGGCHEDAGFATLSLILEEADRKGIFVLALWCPRELNQFPDYLSHLAAHLHRFEARGHVDDLVEPSTRSGVFGQREEERQGSSARCPTLRRVVSEAPGGDIPFVVPVSVRVRVQPRPQESRINPECVGCAQLPQGTLPSDGSVLDRAKRQLQTGRAGSGAEISRPHRVQSEAPPPTSSAIIVRREVGPQRAGDAGVGGDASDRAQRAVTQCGAALRSQGETRPLGSQSQRVFSLSGADQDASEGRRHIHLLPRPRGAECGEAPSQVVRPTADVGSRRSAHLPSSPWV
jgi:hypothetical protein